jgi:acyl-ACP thioesterase
MPSEKQQNPPAKWEEPFEFKLHDPSTQVLEVMDALQLIAWRHAETFGLGFDGVESEARMWVLTRLYVRVPEALPKAESFTLRTWPVGYDKRFGFRDFALLQGDDQFAEATSSWAILEKKSREMVDIGAILAERMPGDMIARNLNFTSRAIPRLKEVEGESAITVSEKDIDINGHVNNVNYLRWAMEALPRELTDGKRATEADVMFRVECFAGDELVVNFAPLKPAEFSYLHSIVRVSDSKEVARVMTVWDE